MALDVVTWLSHTPRPLPRPDVLLTSDRDVPSLNVSERHYVSFYRSLLILLHRSPPSPHITHKYITVSQPALTQSATLSITRVNYDVRKPPISPTAQPRLMDVRAEAGQVFFVIYLFRYKDYIRTVSIRFRIINPMHL